MRFLGPIGEVVTAGEGGITTGDEELGSGDQLAMDEPPKSPVDKKDLLPSEGKGN